MRIGLKFIRLMLFLITCLCFIACGGDSQSNLTRKSGQNGGGNGGGGDGIAPASISYTGLTTPATITNLTARPITEGAFSGGTAAAAFALSETSGAYPSAASVSGHNMNLYNLTKPFSECALNIRSNITAPNSSEKFAPLAIQTENGTINGTCGGNVTYTIQVDDFSGAFSGSFLFSNYCEGGMAISGSTTVNGTLNLAQRVIEIINYTFDEIGSSLITMKGAVTVDNSLYPPYSTIDFDMLIKDNVTGKVHKYDNYTLQTSESTNYIGFGLIGTYYHPDYGYVSVGTLNEFILALLEEWPYPGDLVCRSTDGAQSKLSALSTSTYQISVDLNGDGTYQVLGIYNWTELQ